MADAAIIRSQGWTREQAEALDDAAEGWPELPVPLAAVPVLPAFPAASTRHGSGEITALAEFTQTPRTWPPWCPRGARGRLRPPGRVEVGPAGPSQQPVHRPRDALGQPARAAVHSPLVAAVAERREDARRQGAGARSPSKRNDGRSPTRPPRRRAAAADGGCRSGEDR